MTENRVLIVEDEAIIAANLARTVHSLGYHVIGPVATGEGAIQAVRDFHPNLVLMDIELVGGMNGIIASEKIQTISSSAFFRSVMSLAIVDTPTSFPFRSFIGEDVSETCMSEPSFFIRGVS